MFELKYFYIFLKPIVADDMLTCYIVFQKFAKNQIKCRTFLSYYQNMFFSYRNRILGQTSPKQDDITHFQKRNKNVKERQRF